MASVVVLATACASAPSGEPAGAGTAAPTATDAVASAAGAANTITAAQIAKTNAPTAYHVIDRLHRGWFRDLTGQGEVQVYLHTDQKLGGREVLREIPAHDVALIEYLRSADAIARFGLEASGGAIIITRK